MCYILFCLCVYMYYWILSLYIYPSIIFNVIIILMWLLFYLLIYFIIVTLFIIFSDLLPRRLEHFWICDAFYIQWLLWPVDLDLLEDEIKFKLTLKLCVSVCVCVCVSMNVRTRDTHTHTHTLSLWRDRRCFNCIITHDHPWSMLIRACDPSVITDNWTCVQGRKLRQLISVVEGNLYCGVFSFSVLTEMPGDLYD
jgi:hypothetical protein